MSELRYSIATGDWVIFSKARARRPHDFVQSKKDAAALPEHSASCPFCPGNEAKSGASLFQLTDKGAWKVRSVPNTFPALSPDERIDRKTDGFYTSMGGFGHHEVIVESPRHNTSIALMSDGEVEDIIRVYLSRYITLQAVPGIEAVTIFKNHGPMAGCSMAHPHSQIVATPVVPPHLRGRIALAVNYYEINGSCVYCRMIEGELKAGTRILAETEKFIAFLPFASPFPFIVWILPRRHMSNFSDMDEAEIRDLARTLKHILGKLYRGLGDPDFNLTIRSCPAKAKENSFFHWYLIVIPRLSQPGGFEMGTMMPINTSMPEEGAEFLRQVK
ncbi:MAG: galactose-1-phosphate uridylyltransferase [Candidatus Omnitrophica bacterium]|nr:galactose-1-phosphate uridylyltransferase [Candidatus Omnitrophota bacterium]